MFYKIDMNFIQTFQVTNYIIGENKSELIKLLCGILVYGLITLITVFGVSTNMAVGSSIIVVYTIVTPVIVTYVIIYFRKLFYDSLYENKQSKEVVRGYVKKVYWKFIAYSIVIGVVYAIINSYVFIPIVDSITSPFKGMSDNILNLSGEGVGKIISIVGFTFIQMAITIIITTPVKYIYTYLKLEVSVYDTTPDFNSPIAVIKRKTKEMFRCCMWNVIGYSVMVVVFSLTFMGIAAVIDSIVVAIGLLGVFVVVWALLMWYMEMIIMVKYYNMKNMLGDSK